MRDEHAGNDFPSGKPWANLGPQGAGSFPTTFIIYNNDIDKTSKLEITNAQVTYIVNINESFPTNTILELFLAVDTITGQDEVFLTSITKISAECNDTAIQTSQATGKNNLETENTLQITNSHVTVLSSDSYYVSSVTSWNVSSIGTEWGIRINVPSDYWFENDARCSLKLTGFFFF